MIKNTTFASSFKNAVRGLGVIIRDERNIRIHISVAAAVLWFARYFALSIAEWGVLVLTVSLVILCEGVNTAVERAVDAAVKRFDPVAGAAKDAASAVVLVASVMSVAVGLLLFLRPAVIAEIFRDYTTNPVKAGVLLAYLVLAVLFIRGGRKRYE